MRPAEDSPVIDIHPPHQAAHSWRDIAIHLATITIGLFIALTLEGCVEWQHHRHMVREARENIHSEVLDNQKELTSALREIGKEQQQIKQDVDALLAMQKGATTEGAHVALGFNNSSLQSASWNTAHETGALAYMPYPEVKSYSEMYDLQNLFATETTRLMSTYTNAFSIAYIFEQKDQVPEPAKRTAMNQAIQQVLAVQSELLVYDAVAKELQHKYAQVLEERH